MPRLNKETKERIRKLDYKDLQDIVIALASKDKAAYDYILLNYLDKENAEEDLFEETRDDLDFLFIKEYKGYAKEAKAAHMMAACVRRINEFTKVSKNKVLEAELLLFVLRYVFSSTTTQFGTCFSQYDTKVAMMVKRLITIVTKKLPADHIIGYRDEINEYLQILHKMSSVNTVYNLPDAI